MMVLVILLGLLDILLGLIVFLQFNTIDSIMNLRRLENEKYDGSIKQLKQQLEAAQNAYLTLGRYILENKEKLNEQD